MLRQTGLEGSLSKAAVVEADAGAEAFNGGGEFALLLADQTKALPGDEGTGIQRDGGFERSGGGGEIAGFLLQVTQKNPRVGLVARERQ